MPAFELKIKPDPDFGRFKKVLGREGTPDRVPFYELFSNIEQKVMEALGMATPPPNASPRDAEFRLFQWKRHAEYQYRLGYDYLCLSPFGFGFPTNETPSAATDQGKRHYVQAKSHTIASREDFDKYPWPKFEDINCSPMDWAEKNLPEGMMAISGHSGILENVMWLLGYEPMSYLLYDDPQLVEDMFRAVAEPIVAYFDLVASYDIVGAIQMGEDMGFKTQTMFPPDVYRKYLFPWHKTLVDTVHRHGKPVILHACGNLELVMEDIIACGWDAKHSFEDIIEPVWSAKQRYGGRISVMGGFDMDKISRMTTDEVRKHTRFLIEKCAPGGGWALGTGNSVANYIPVENFLAMLEEGYLAARG